MAWALLTTLLLFPADEPLSKDLAALQGAWTITSLTVQGEKTEFAEKPARWTIKGNKVLYAGAELATLTVAGDLTPKLIDLAFAKPKRTLEGIYAIDGDTLKLCVSTVAEGVRERPALFTTEDRPDRRLLTLKRLSAEEAEQEEDLPGFVGVMIAFDELKKQVRIMDTIPDSPARAAGLKPDDLLLLINNVEAGGVQNTVRLMRQVKPGQEVVLRIQRDGKDQDVKVKAMPVPFFLLD